jgi:DNA-directed RNA polymerase subunit beta
VPESFRVLVKELQSLCLDVRVLDRDGNEIVLRDEEDDDAYMRPPVDDEALLIDENLESRGFTIEDAEDFEEIEDDEGEGEGESEFVELEEKESDEEEAAE